MTEAASQEVEALVGGSGPDAQEKSRRFRNLLVAGGGVAFITVIYVMSVSKLSGAFMRHAP